MVCCVGNQSTRSENSEKPKLDEDTPLQTKLKNLETHFTKLSMFSTILIALIMIIMLFIKLGMKDSNNMAANEAGGFSTFIDQIIKQGNFIVVLWIMSIPEGLPVTIGISLAFSVMKMYNDKLLVRKLDAPEKLGTVQEVVCSKTGTIT